MNPTNPLPALAIVLMALASAWVLARLGGQHQSAPERDHHYASIDGLRGYLALLVFVHHTCLWFFYLRTGHWTLLPSALYTHMGDDSVSLFFMITAFLFFGRLLDVRHKPINWSALMISRVFRLAPLYLVLMGLLGIVVAQQTGWREHESLGNLLRHIAAWLAFTLTDEPNVNGLHDTFTVVAGVTWSLPYEWFFYGCLPVLGWLVGAKPPLVFKLFGLACMVAFWLWHPAGYNIDAFLGGMAAAGLARWAPWRRWAKSRLASVLVVACIAAGIARFPSVRASAPIALLSMAFAIIAGGNSLFGSLTSRPSRLLGEMAYSVYLLHGVMLYVTFNWIIGLHTAMALSPQSFWLLALAMTPLLMTLCHFSFAVIEDPCIRAGRAVARAVSSRYTERGAHAVSHATVPAR